MPIVATAAELVAALKAAAAGAVILIAPDAYVDGLVVRPLKLPPGIVVTSADPDRPGKIANALLNGVENLTFRGPLEFEVTGTGAAYGITCGQCRKVTFDGVFVHGVLDDDVATDVSGLSFLGGSDIVVINSRFRELRQAAGFGGPMERVWVEGNDLQRLRKTGFVFAGVSDVVVRGNLIADIRPATVAEHPDAIQFFTTGQTAPGRNILIAENVIHRGGGAATQGIFMRDQTLRMAYENVTIADNLIVGTGWSGIAVSNINGLTLERNTLVTTGTAREDRTYLFTTLVNGLVSEHNRAIAMTFDNVTDLVRAGDKLTKPVTDGGLTETMTWTRHRTVEANVGETAAEAPQVRAGLASRAPRGAWNTAGGYVVRRAALMATIQDVAKAAVAK